MTESTNAATSTPVSGAPSVYPIPAQANGPALTPPSPEALFSLGLDAEDIRSDLGMGLLHLGPAPDSALEWFNKVESRLLLLENALKNAAKGQQSQKKQRGHRSPLREQAANLAYTSAAMRAEA